MSETKRTTAYTEYHPRWYRKDVSTWWWLGRWPYLKFILREISSVFVAWSVVVLLLQLRSLSRGPQAYADFEKWLRNPLILLLNLITLFFVVFHAVTWFNRAQRDGSSFSRQTRAGIFDHERKLRRMGGNLPGCSLVSGEVVGGKAIQ